MPTIDQLTAEQLASPQVFDKVKNLVEEIARFSEEDRAFEMSEQMRLALAKLLETNKDGGAYENYRPLQISLLWTAFVRLAEEDAVELLRTALLLALKQGVAIQGKIVAKLFFLPYAGRDELRRRMIKAVESNTEKLGEKRVSEWLALYNQFEDFMGRDDLSIINFLNQSQSARNLNEEERKVLENIFKLYDTVLTFTLDLDEEAAEEILQAEDKQPFLAPESGVAASQQLTSLAPPPNAPEALLADKYRQPVDPKDLKNKFKIEAPQRKPLSMDEGFSNPANVVDLRDNH